ncbi:MAG: PAS domain S-box protein [Syntrophaceae bacterium]|nr:PAS domain S-box protein [Syntrophaceae bacterium]
MTDIPFLGLIHNAALLLAVAFIFDVSATRWTKGRTSLHQLPVGFVIGVIGITVMLTSWTFMPGIIFDTRSVLLGISGLFFGLIPTVIAMAMTALFRIHQGGPGVLTGVSVIVTTGTIGIAWRHLRRGSLDGMSWREIYLFGLVIHLAMLSLMLTLPWESALRALSNLTLPVLAVFPLGTTFLGVLMVNRLKREQAEDMLRKNEEKYRFLFENAVEGILIAQDEKVQFVNPSLVNALGYPEEVIKNRPFVSFIHPEDRRKVLDRHLRRLGGEEVETGYDFRAITASGAELWLEIHSKAIPWEGVPASLNFLIDVTERKRTEQILRRQQDRLDLAQSAGKVGVFDWDMVSGKEIWTSQLEILYGMEPEQREHRGYEWLPLIHPEDREEAESVVKRSIREGRKEMEADYRIVHKNGDVRWMSIRATITYDASGHPVRMVGTCVDITERKQLEMEREAATDRLRRGLAATVQAISIAVEARDPYTAGHQKRTADLARAIATEMGLPADQIDFIRIAATIHDIGKISVPAEILSKPTKLSAIEFRLIQIHPETGHEILKDIDFPWPVAEVILQHHERMDGSGYPHGITGESILIEARILAVADVVESMASHRPYRPALGIEVAMEEISGNQGLRYDPDVVSACVRLFREKGYSLD